MDFFRRAASAAAVMVSALALGLITATPAVAATGSWRAYGNVSPISSSPDDWDCARTVTITTDVYAQVCVVTSETVDRRAAVIVRNNRSSLYSVEAAADLSDTLRWYGRWECRSSGVGANSWSVCFGSTVTSYFSVVESRGGANGVDLKIARTS